MTTVKTATGFECSVNESCMNDFEVLEMLQGIQNGEVYAFISLVNKILSADDAKRLKDKVRTEDGRVPIDAIAQEVGAILSSVGGTAKK